MAREERCDKDAARRHSQIDLSEDELKLVVGGQVSPVDDPPHPQG
jgi:hypothetical protein